MGTIARGNAIPSASLNPLTGRGGGPIIQVPRSSVVFHGSHHFRRPAGFRAPAVFAIPPFLQGFPTAGASSPAPMSAAGTVIPFPSPVVLRVLPLRGSPAPVGYIYDATPDADGGLLAAALAFFSHRGHQVFYDPCPDLAAYRWSRVWFRPSSLSIACRIISFLRGWSFWRVSLLPRPPLGDGVFGSVPRISPFGNLCV